MKLITLTLILSVLLSCNTRSSNNEIIYNSKIQKDTLKIKNKIITNEKTFKEIDILGKWENEKCSLSFQIFKKRNQYNYIFKSEKREISDTLEITQEDRVIYLNFKGIEWFENKGELGPEYFEETSDSLIQEKEEVLPIGITALFDSKEKNFVIQNYGNAMNYYTKLEEGCEKYIYFYKKEYASNDTLNILSKFLSKSIKNHSVLHWKKGDINNDKIDDFIVVLQNEYPNKELTGMDNSYQRIVVLLETVKSYPNFKLASLNHNILECSNCGGAGVGDPFVGISIKNNYFSIEQLFGACDKSFIVTTFKYEKNKWLLHKIGQDDYSCNQVNENDEIKITHKIKTKKDFGLIEFKNYR